MKKIGFFEKWNEVAQTIEFSITRVQMIAFMLFTMGFVWKYFISENNPIDANSLLLVCILLAASFSPKLLKDIIDKRFEK